MHVFNNLSINKYVLTVFFPDFYNYQREFKMQEIVCHFNHMPSDVRYLQMAS